MAKGGYFYETSGVARKLKKGYHYDSTGVARKIKKGYRFDASGVARPCWSGGELAYYGTVTGPSAYRSDSAAARAGNYALIGGGDTLSVEAYSSSLTKASVTSLRGDGSFRSELAAASVGDWAIFSGGYHGEIMEDAYVCTPFVDLYNSSLSKITTANTLDTPVYQHASTSVGQYAIIAGGQYWYPIDEEASVTSQAYAYNSSATRTKLGALKYAVVAMGAGSIGGYALFGGGTWGGSVRNAVTAYSSSLSKSNPTSLGIARYSVKATAVGNYLIFAGGYNKTNTTARTYADAYDSSLTRSTITALSAQRHDHEATTLGNYALFIGGNLTAARKTVDVYDASLTRTNRSDLSYEHYNHVAVTVGNYAIIAGGTRSGNTAEAYTIG